MVSKKEIERERQNEKRPRKKKTAQVLRVEKEVRETTERDREGEGQRESVYTAQDRTFALSRPRAAVVIVVVGVFVSSLVTVAIPFYARL